MRKLTEQSELTRLPSWFSHRVYLTGKGLGFSLVVVKTFHIKFTRTESPVKATFHLTISMRGQRATGKIQRKNYLSCGPSSSVLHRCL